MRPAVLLAFLGFFSSFAFPEKLKRFEDSFPSTHAHAELPIAPALRLLFLPYFSAYYDLPHYGLLARPYRRVESRKGPVRLAHGRGRDNRSFRFASGYQAVSTQVLGYFVSARSRTAHRLGWDISLSGYSEDFSPKNKNLTLLSGYLTATYIQTPRVLLDFGLGGRSLFGAGSRGGPGILLNLEIFPMRPLILRARGDWALVQNRSLWDILGEASVMLWAFEISAGYRSLRAPGENLSGPRFSFGIWF